MALMRTMRRLCALLVLGLGYLGWAVVLATVVWLIGQAAGFLPDRVVVVGSLLVTSVAFAAAGAIALRRAMHPPPPEELEIDGQRQARLWQAAGQTSDQVGAARPDRLVLTMSPELKLVEGIRLLGLLPGRRTLRIGVPLLMGLTVTELRSLIAHECAHHNTADGRLPPVIYRNWKRLAGVADSLAGTPGRLFLAACRPYLGVSRPVVHRQEFLADYWAAHTTTPQIAIRALTERLVVATAWREFAEEFPGPVAGRRPQGIAEGFAMYWMDPARQGRLEEIRGQQDADSVEDAWGTHPTTAERLEHLAELPAPGFDADDDGEPAVGLLYDAEVWLAQLEATVHPGTTTVSWDEYVNLHRLAQDRRRAGLLLAAATESSGTEADLGSVFEALTSGRIADITRRVPRGETAGELTDEELVLALVTVALSDAGIARYRIDWSGRGVVVDEDGDPLPLAASVSAAVRRPTQAAALRDWLADCDIDLGSRPVATDRVASPG